MSDNKIILKDRKFYADRGFMQCTECGKIRRIEFIKDSFACRDVFNNKCKGIFKDIKVI